MKILHTSDWHLGATEKTGTLRDDQIFFIDEICKTVVTENIKAVLIAGDIYDRSVPAAEAIKLYDYAMTRLCKELEVPVLVIAGNHDSAERLSSCGELLEQTGLHVAGSLEKTVKCISIGDTEFFMLPWFTEEKVKSLFPENKEDIQSLDDAYRLVTRRMKERFSEGKKHVVLSHSYVTTAETSTSDRAAEIGFASQISADVFDGFDYVALGHIHKPQDISPTIRYCGTPMPYSFGKEETQEKSVTVIDTSSMEKKTVVLPLLHKRTTIEGTKNEILGADIDEKVRNGYVRLRVTDSYVGLETLSELKEKYPLLIEVEGKTFESEHSSVSMTMEEFEKLESNPIEIFKQFCRETMNEDPGEYLVGLFEKAVAESEEGEI